MKIKAVLPLELPVFAVGGIDTSNMLEWLNAGLRSMTRRESPLYCAAQVDDWRDDARVPVYLAGRQDAMWRSRGDTVGR